MSRSGASTGSLDFVGVGGLSYDLVLRVVDFPSADSKVPAQLLGRFPGGYIANATTAAARLGLRSGYAGWIGDDSDGVFLRDDFVTAGVDTGGLLKIQGEPTPFTIIMVNEHGERVIMLPHFALYEQELSQQQIDYAAQAQVIYTFPNSIAWCEQLAQAAHSSGGLFVLDIEKHIPLVGSDLQRVVALADTIFVTEDSLRHLGVQSLQEMSGERWIIMTAGSRGAYGIAPNYPEAVFQPSFEVVAVDTTGAGDCFHAALLAAKQQGAYLPEALEFASAAAALKVQHEGARSGQPDQSAVQQFLENMEQSKDS